MMNDELGTRSSFIIPRSSFLLLLILALAAGLRIARISSDSLSFDDMWHLELSTGRGSPHVRLPQDTFIPAAPAVTSLKDAPPFYKVWTSMDWVVHPPLYPLLLRIWRAVFGEGDIHARSFSITLSLVTIALMFLAAKELSGLAVAAWAALIFAVAPTQVYLAQHVRGYPLLLALGMSAVLAVIRLERASTPSPGTPGEGRGGGFATVALGICLLGIMLTHYFAIGACVAIGVYVLLRLRGDVRRGAVAALVIAGAVYLVTWGPYFKQQLPFFASTADTWLMENDSRHVGWTFGRLASWPWWLIARQSFDPPFHLAWAFVLVLPLFLLRRRGDLLIWYLWLLGTLGFVTALDLFRGTNHLRLARYVSPASPAVFVLLCACAWSIRRWLLHAIAVAMVLAALGYWSLAYTSEGEPDWRPLGAAIDANVAPGETLIFYPGVRPAWHDQIYYLAAAHYSHGFPRPIIKLSGPAPQTLLRQVPGQTAWLISGPLDRAISQLLPGAEVIGSPIVLNDREIRSELAILTHLRLNTPQYADTLR